MEPTRKGVGAVKGLVLATMIGALGSSAVNDHEKAPLKDDFLTRTKPAHSGWLYGEEGGAGGEAGRPIVNREASFLLADHKVYGYYDGPGYGGEGAEGGEGGEGGEGRYIIHHHPPVEYPDEYHPPVPLVDGACLSNQAAGAILGGAVGAVAGAQFGSGSERHAAIAVGTLIGAIIGSEVGASLDKVDQACAYHAEQQAHTAPIGQTIAWENHETGHSGTITPTREGYDTRTSRYCREYQTTVTIGGRTQQAYGTACRQPDGSWEIAG
ncbi:MAG: RT0821/Lpp0805 family surface protein [Candidatus Methylomirabilales bacterium]